MLVPRLISSPTRKVLLQTIRVVNVGSTWLCSTRCAPIMSPGNPESFDEWTRCVLFELRSHYPSYRSFEEATQRKGSMLTFSCHLSVVTLFNCDLGTSKLGRSALVGYVRPTLLKETDFDKAIKFSYYSCLANTIPEPAVDKVSVTP